MSDENRDFFLQTLVTVTNEIDYKLGITLMVGGSIVSGTLINSLSYFRGLEEQFKELGGSGTALLFKKMADLTEEYRATLDTKNEQDPQSSEGDEDNEVKSVYIHLENARLFTAGQTPLPANQGVYWRGKISSVDAFWFGNLQAE